MEFWIPICSEPQHDSFQPLSHGQQFLVATQDILVEAIIEVEQ
jgi:hypothetical protein